MCALKKLVTYIALFPALSISAYSCTIEQEKDFGYPENVYFNADGGSQVITGTRPVSGITLGNKNGDGVGATVDDDSINAQWDWLAAKTARGEHKITVTASPNVNSQSRVMVIEAYGSTDYTRIKVVQDG